MLMIYIFLETDKSHFRARILGMDIFAHLLDERSPLRPDFWIYPKKVLSYVEAEVQT